MCSYEERLRAVKFYLKYGRRLKGKRPLSAVLSAGAIWINDGSTPLGSGVISSHRAAIANAP